MRASFQTVTLFLSDRNCVYFVHPHRVKVNVPRIFLDDDLRPSPTYLLHKVCNFHCNSSSDKLDDTLDQCNVFKWPQFSSSIANLRSSQVSSTGYFAISYCKKIHRERIGVQTTSEQPRETRNLISNFVCCQRAELMKCEGGKKQPRVRRVLLLFMRITGITHLLSACVKV